MSIYRKIKEIVSGVAYGCIDQRLSQREKIIIGFGGLVIAIVLQLILAWWLMPKKALLNIFVFPFQLIGVLSLIYLVQGVTKYPYGNNSLWCLESEKYIPFFIRARGFLYQPYTVLFMIGLYLAVYMDINTEQPHFYFWFIASNIYIILAFFAARWLKTFLEKIEDVISNIKNILPSEKKSNDYVRLFKNEMFNKKELLFIFTGIILIKLNDVLNADATWGGSVYIFPLTALWTAFSMYILPWCALAIYCSVAYVYIKVFLTLKNLKYKKFDIFLFHPDGCAGLGTVVDFIFFCIGKILIVISFISLSNFLAFSFSMVNSPINSWFNWILGIIIFLDLTALVIFLYPLKEIRNIIKRKKEEERKLLLERIKQKEGIYLKRNIESNEFQEIENNFKIIKYIDSIPEWGIDTRQWLSLFTKVLLTFNGIALQFLMKYLNLNI